MVFFSDSGVLLILGLFSRTEHDPVSDSPEFQFMFVLVLRTPVHKNVSGLFHACILHLRGFHNSLT